MKTPDAGYEGSDPGDDIPEPGTRVKFILEKVPRMYASGIMAHIRRGKVPIGLINLKSEAEFRWLKKRIDGEMEAE